MLWSANDVAVFVVGVAALVLVLVDGYNVFETTDVLWRRPDFRQLNEAERLILLLLLIGSRSSGVTGVKDPCAVVVVGKVFGMSIDARLDVICVIQLRFSPC